MRNPRLVIAVVVSVIAIFLISAAPQTFASTGLNISIVPDQAMLKSGGALLATTSTAYSTNWAGYAVNAASGTVSEAQGSWIQPTVTCSTSADGAQYAAFWVGIDGYASLTVEQTGTLAYCPQGTKTPEYLAWYEFYSPGGEPIQQISTVAIHPGNKIQAVIKYSSTKLTISVTLRDVTDGQSYTTTNPTGFSFSRSSAECITETPTENTITGSSLALLASFGSVSWGKDYTAIKSTCTATVSGSTKPIGNFGTSSVEIEMCNEAYTTSCVAMATPSAISTDGTSFKIAFESAGP